MTGLSKSDEDYIDTQILDVDNTGLKITQDIVVSLGVSYLAEKAVKGTVYQLGGKQALNAATRRFNVKVTQKMMERIARTANQRLTGSFTKQLTQLFSRKAASVVLKSLGKAAASAAAKAGTVAAGGCTLGPVGCAAGSAVGAAVFAGELAFTIFATVQDIQDKKGMLTLFHKEYVDFIAKDFKDTLDKTYETLGAPGFMEEEAFFYPEFFLISFDEDSTPYMDMDNPWAQKFIDYQNDYLKKIGIQDGWEDRIPTQTMDPPRFTVERDDVKKIASGVILAGSLFACVLLIFIVFIVIL